MKLLLSGFLPRDEMVFDLFLKRFMPAWRWHGQPAKRDHALPDADILVIDLAAHGWAQHNAAAAAGLALATADHVVVLLTAPHDASWQAALAGQRGRWVCLAKPYNAEAMRRVLAEAADLVKARQKRPVPIKPVTPSIPSPVLPLMATAGVTVVAAPSPVAAAVVAVAAGHGINTQQLAQRLADFPADSRVLLRKMLAALQTQMPFEVRFTMQHFLIIHPADDWVASNTPMSVVFRVAGSDALAASVSVRALGLAQAEDRLHQLGVLPHDLGDFLFDLVTQTLPGVRPATVALA